MGAAALHVFAPQTAIILKAFAASWPLVVDALC